MKKIGIIDADLIDGGTKFPNLALMKISGYFKERGDSVELLSEVNPDLVTEYDEIYISKVFDYTELDESILEYDNVHYGGTGFFFDKAEDLPYEIEHHKPDYELYRDYTDKKLSDHYYKSAIGFATRGCFRKCSFCVNRKSDKVKFHSHINEWDDPDKKKIILLDDNILAYSNWREVFNELEETGKRFKFQQGLDIRLLTEEKARVLSQAKYSGEYIFAFDDIEDKDLITEKLKLWRKYSDGYTKLYVLAGFVGQDEREVESIFERIKILSEYKCLPFVMKHKNLKGSKYESLIKQIARWCNQPQFVKKMTFKEFCDEHQKYIKTDKVCAAVRAYREFEEEHPDIALKYFDKKFYENF